MIQKLRIKLARWILGNECSCYKLGYHPLCNFKQRSAEAIVKQKERKK